jgi:tetratricopeptide (TPR) repeat protein
VTEADALVATTAHPRDALTWATMRALLDGRRDAARTGVEELRLLAKRTDDAEAWDRYRIQRFWLAAEWGTDQERADALDHCRERAYRFDDLAWWGNLTLLLVLMGKQDEAVRAFDAAAALAASASKDGPWLDAVTNLVEAAAGLGDAGRVAAVSRSVRWPEGRLVVVGGGAVCKGSVDRYRALAFAATGKLKQAEDCFRSAESTHRAIGAGPLLARTLQQASMTLVAA